MSSVRTVGWVILVGLLMPPAVRADSMSNGGWTVYYSPTAAAQDLNTTAPSVGPGPADAFINFGTAPYSEASELTTGTAQPWYLSPAVTQAFGHTPTPSEQSAFASEVLNDVNTTYSLAGLSPRITIDPKATADHTISVVSGLSYGANANAIGITDVGHDGFGFIDKLQYASNTTDLAWAVAHNVAHELMHAFGVAVHSDQTGQYIDGASASWNLLVDPKATFGATAAGLIGATNFGPSVTSAATTPSTGLMKIDGDQEILAVPEPTTLAAWALVATGSLAYRRRRAA